MQIFISDSACLITAKISWLSRFETSLVFTPETRFFIHGQLYLGMKEGTAMQGGYRIHWKKLS